MMTSVQNGKKESKNDSPKSRSMIFVSGKKKCVFFFGLEIRSAPISQIVHGSSYAKFSWSSFEF